MGTAMNKEIAKRWDASNRAVNVALSALRREIRIRAMRIKLQNLLMLSKETDKS